MIISRYGPVSSGKGRIWYSSWAFVSIISIFTFSPAFSSSPWITSIVSVIRGNWALRPISRISVSTGTPSARASSTRALALAAS